MDEFNFKPAWYRINKIIQLTKPVFGRFQNGCNREVIEPRVVQFWAEIIRVISNGTHATRSFDFEITRMISAHKHGGSIRSHDCYLKRCFKKI